MWCLWSHLRMGPCLAGLSISSFVAGGDQGTASLSLPPPLSLLLFSLPSLFYCSPSPLYLSLSITFPLFTQLISRAELLWDQGWTGHWRLQWQLQHPQKTEVYLTLSLPKPLALFFFLFPSLPSPSPILLTLFLSFLIFLLFYLIN